MEGVEGGEDEDRSVGAAESSVAAASYAEVLSKSGGGSTYAVALSSRQAGHMGQVVANGRASASNGNNGARARSVAAGSVAGGSEMSQPEFAVGQKRGPGRPKGSGTKQKTAFAGQAQTAGADGDGVAFDDTEEKNKRGREMQRDCLVIPYVQFGFDDQRFNGNMLWILNDFPVFHAFPRVWWMRNDMRDRTNTALTSGPFQQRETLDWVMNKAQQVRFAEKFYIPFHNNDYAPFRQLNSDTRDYTHMEDATSRVLFAAIATHEPSELDMPLTQEIEHVVLPQFSKDMVSVNQLHGVQGGIVGIDPTVFWYLSVNEDLHITPKDFLSCVTSLCQAFSPGTSLSSATNYTFWPGISTAHTVLTQCTRTRTIKGASFKTKGHADVLKSYHCRSTVDDVDDTLLQQILQHRVILGDDVKDLAIAPHKQTNRRAKSGKPIPDDDLLPTTQSITGLFDAHLHIDVFRGRDSAGKFVFIKLHSFRITPKVPGVDPCIAFQQWMTSGKLDPSKKTNVINILDHMCRCINKVFFHDCPLLALVDFTDSIVHNRHPCERMTCSRQVPIFLFKFRR